MTNQAHQQQQRPNMTQPQVVQAKFSYTPLIMTTLITTMVTLGVGFAFSRWSEKKKEADEEKRDREREERAGMMPPMPMMWPGAGGASANPAPSAMGPMGPTAPSQPSAAPVPRETQEKLTSIVDRLSEWEQNLGARESHLSLVGDG